MILLVSNRNELETNNVIDWLDYYGKKYCIEDDYNRIITLFNNEKFSSIWFRKIAFNPNESLGQEFEQKSYAIMQRKEFDYSLAYFDSLSKRRIGRAKYFIPNKLIYLECAKQVGLKIPQTYISNSKYDLIKRIKDHEKVVTKQLSDINVVKSNDLRYEYLLYSKIIDSSCLNLIPDYYFPSIIQQYIKPAYEIKGLYFNSRFSCISINSVGSVQYSDLKELMKDRGDFDFNQYSLSPVLRKKIKLLFDKMDLNFGVFDGIVDEKGEFYFLEINPNGNFSFIERVSPMEIYSRIAKYLS